MLLFPNSFSVGVLFSLTLFYTLARYSFTLIHNCFLISQNVLQADLLYNTENYLSSRYLYVMSNQLSLTYDYSLTFSFKTLCDIISFCCVVFTSRLTLLKLCMFVAGKDVEVKNWTASSYLCWWTPAIMRCRINKHFSTKHLSFSITDWKHMKWANFQLFPVSISSLGSEWKIMRQEIWKW